MKFINKLNPYVFIPIWIILMLILGSTIPTLMTMPSTLACYFGLALVVIFVYLCGVGYMYLRNFVLNDSEDYNDDYKHDSEYKQNDL